MPGYQKHIVVLILMVLSTGNYAQYFLQADLLSVEHGLSSHRINDLVFDNQGFLWAATDIGLNRYDGYNFKHISLALSTSAQTENKKIKKLSYDNNGILWMISDACVIRLMDNQGRSQELACMTENTYGEVIDILFQDDGTLWILTKTGLLKYISDSNTEFYPFQLENLNPSSMISDRQGMLWIGTDQGPLVFNLQNSMFSQMVFTNFVGLLSDNQINALYCDDDNMLWMGTDNGLNYLNPVDFDFMQLYPSGRESGFQGNRILDIAKYDDDRLLLVTAGGIYILNKKNNSFTLVFEPYSGLYMHSAEADVSGNIWAATSDGIIKIRRSNITITNFTRDSRNNILSDNNISYLKTDADGLLWIGNVNSGIDILNTLNNNVKHYNIFSEGEVTGIFDYSADEMLITGGNQIVVFNHVNNTKRDIKEVLPYYNSDLLSENIIRTVQVDSVNKIWIGTSNGLHLLDKSAGNHQVIRSLKMGNDSIEINEVFDLFRDKNGNLWIGTDNGLIMYNHDKALFYRLTPYDKQLLNTENKKVYKLKAESDNILWVGTSRGILRFSIPEREFTAITDSEALLTSSVNDLAVDRSGNLWIGIENGLYYYDKLNKILMFFDRENGFINYSYTAITSDASGNVFLGGEYGLSIVNTTSIVPVNKYHNVIVTDMFWLHPSFREEIEFNNSDTITISWQKFPLQIDFAVLDLTRPENNQFRYSFVKSGRDKVWTNAGTQNHVIIDRLAPGTYIFELEGSNAYSLWNPETYSIIIQIKGSFWRSRTAIGLYLLLFLLLAATGFKYLSQWLMSISRESKVKEEIARKIIEQKEELSSKNKSITDSINYAKRIQTALLPPIKMLNSLFSSSFIVYMPKDIVSGDFYWINKMNDKIFVAAVDCTGHGVPGAFMSVIGFELFRKITNIDGLTRPSDILNRLNSDFHEVFKDVDNVVLRDGMDVAFCSIDKDDKILEFAGAFNPLYLIRDNKITEVKGDRFAIGLDETNFMEQTFKNHLIPLQNGDVIYLFSDGFADQFGGPDGKKYKYRRFKHLLLNLHSLPMEKQKEILENNVMEWRGDQEQVDDILIIGIKIDF